jgi:hypothetical protein
MITGQEGSSGFRSGKMAGKPGHRPVMQKKRVQTMGELILQVAEALKPGLQDEFEGVRDENGMPVQPARVRGIAIIIAQELVKAHMARKKA